MPEGCEFVSEISLLLCGLLCAGNRGIVSLGGVAHQRAGFADCAIADHNTLDALHCVPVQGEQVAARVDAAAFSPKSKVIGFKETLRRSDRGARL